MMEGESHQKHSLVSRLHFSHLPEKWVWSTAYSIFVQVRRNVGALFFSNLMFDVIKDCIPHCVRSTREMDVDRATLAAVYRLGFSIFRKEHE